MENPDKSLICVVNNLRSVDYYVSDKKKFSEAEKRFKNNEKKWHSADNIGKLGKGIKPDFSSEVGVGASYIVFNSCLYRMGGLEDEEGSRRVAYLDLKKMNNNVWVECPMMNHERINPYPVIFGGQLYVVGGLFTESVETPVLMEVLKRDGSGWEDIPNPPPYPEVPQPPPPSDVVEPTIHKKEEIDESAIYVSDDEEEEENHPINVSNESREVEVSPTLSFEFKESEREEESESSREEPKSGESEGAEGSKQPIPIRPRGFKKNLMEKAFFETIFPPYSNYLSEKEKKDEKERIDSEYFRGVYAKAIVGVVKSDDRDFIVVGVDNRLNIFDDMSLAFYTYESRRKWMPYIKMDLTDLHDLDFLPEQSAVVSGQLILFLGQSERTEMLYILDFEKDLLHSFNLSKLIPDIEKNMCKNPFLVRIDEDKFDVFWAMYGPEWKSKTSGKLLGSISTIMSSTLTVKRNEASHTSLCVEVTQNLHWFSLIPQLKSHMLKAVLIR